MSAIKRAIVFWLMGFALVFCGIHAGDVSAASDSLDQLYEKAKKEGKITIYAPLSAQAMTVVPAGFMKRFPGITVDHIDGTSDKLIARVLAEQKGGRVIADVLSGALTYLPQILDLKISAPLVSAGGCAVSGTAQRRPLGRNRHAILHRRLEYQSSQKRRGAKELRGTGER